MKPTLMYLEREMSKSIHQLELESLSNKVFTGDITPIVFDLLKESRHLEDLVSFLSKGDKTHDSNNNTQETVRKEDYNRPCFEEWFRNAERL